MAETERPDTAVVIPAAGEGRRIGGTKKQYRELGGKTVLLRTVAVFERHPRVGCIVVATTSTDLTATEQLLTAVSSKPVRVVEGGSTRQASVTAALGLVDASAYPFVLIHDAVRPFVSEGDISAVLRVAERCGGAALALPVSDTLRRVEGARFVETIPREDVFRMQTPQAFSTRLAKQAFDRARIKGWTATDDVDLLMRCGNDVEIVTGDARNIKITTPGDWEIAQHLWRTENVDHEREMTTRLGFGYDVHRLVKGRPLVLGGVRIDSDFGLEGHSDADVLLHAITDAVLGAAGLGDIGTHFPDDDPTWKNANSADLLERALALVHAEGLHVGNVDATVVLERPKIQPYVQDIRKRISQVLGINPSHVSIKATTNEMLGPIGRREGAAAFAVCALAGASTPPQQTDN